LNIQESGENGFFWNGIHINDKTTTDLSKDKLSNVSKGKFTLSGIGNDSDVSVFTQTCEEILFYADSLMTNWQYEQVISLLQSKKDVFLNSESPDNHATYNLYLGNAYLTTQVYDKAETYLKEGCTIIEKEYGKYSEEYCDKLPLLIEVYDLTYNYEKLIDSYLSYIEIIEKVYGKNVPEYSNSLNVLGYLYMQLGKYDLAEQYLTQALELRETNLGKEHADYIITLNNLGLLYFSVGNFEKARTVFIQIKEQYETQLEKGDDFYAGILMQLGYIDLYTGNYESSEYCLLTAKEIYENNNQTNTLSYIGNLRFIGELNIAKNNYIEAEKYLIDAKELYISLGGDINADYATIVADLASIYNATGKYETAETCFLEAIKIYRETIGAESAFYATTVSNLGIMYFYIGNYSDAEKCFSETKAIQEKIIGMNHPDYARTLGNLGSLYQKTENYQLAEKYLLQSKEIYENNNLESSQYTLLMNNLGLLYFEIGNAELARDYLLKSAQVMAGLSGTDTPDYALTALNLSGVLSQWGNDTLAVKYAIAAALTFENNLGKEHPYYILALNTIGYIRTKQGMYDKAEWELLEADSLFIKVFGREHSNRILTLNNLADLYMKQEKYELALKSILEAKELIGKTLNKEHSYNLVTLVTYENLSLIYWLMGNYELSTNFVYEWDKYLTQRIHQNFFFMSEKQREDFWNNNNGYALEQFTNTLLSDYATSKTQSLAYNNTLFSKGLLLRSTNEIRDAILNSGNQNLINQFESLRALRQQITALQAKTDKYEKDYIQSLEIRADSLDKIITVASSAYREQKADLNMDWKDVQKNLSDNEIAIEFVDYQKFNKGWTDTTLYAALIVRKNFESPVFVPLFEKSQLDLLLADANNDTEKRIGKLYNGGNPRFYNGQKLYQLVWQPLEKYLSDIETVYYSPSGTLNQISFAAIPADTLLLNDKYNLHLLSSTREIVQMKKKDFLPVRQAVAYGGIHYDVENPQDLLTSAKPYQTNETQYFASRSLPNDSTRSGWSFLQGTEKEVVEIENILQKTNVPNTKYIGISANEESVKNLSGRSPELLHIATHGFFLADEEKVHETGFMQMMNSQNHSYINPLLRSGLLFAGANRAWKNENVIPNIEDGILTAEEISQLNLSKTKLVVLSACETGLGEVQNSEGVFGLQRAFKLAGVETLIMSLWKVPDEATSELMISFYTHWLSGKTKQEAFKIAQKEVRESYKNPYFWAGFVLMD
jgi:CHAT domain-containing protein/tetratricopeptide (TPR) repeat protein